MSSRRGRWGGAIAAAAVGAFFIGRSLASFVEAGDPSPVAMSLVEDEAALWDEMDAVHLPPVEEPAVTGQAPVPTRSRFVVEKAGHFEAVVVECVGECEQRGCGMPYRPGCQPSDSCRRTVIRAGLELDSRAEANIWLREQDKE